jgi:O-antigen ligase
MSPSRTVATWRPDAATSSIGLNSQMSTVVTAPVTAPAPRSLSRGNAETSIRDDAWPHTTRALPWLLAGFLVMLWLVPFQDVQLPIRLPVDAKLDRFVLAGMALVWIAALLVGGRGLPRLQRSIANVGVAAFAAAAAASVLLNLEVLVTVDDFTLAVKKLALLAAYITFFFVAASTLRPQEVRPFVVLMIALACVTALGTVWEYRTTTNLFYDFTAKLLPPGFSLAPETGDQEFARPAVTGPTQHGLALTTILAFALPFAVVSVLRAPTTARKLAYAAATALILAGAMATLRKTAVVMPAAALLVLLLYWPRQMLRLAPLGLVLILVIQALSPGALASIRGQLEPGRFNNSTSTQGRKDDYEAVAPDVKAHLATGRGYGTYDSRKYRLLDNQYLALLIETGFIGLVAYLAMIAGVIAAAHRTIRSLDPMRAPPALAAAAGAAAFLVCTALFDVLAFPQVPYLFFFVAAIAVVTARAAPNARDPGARAA